MKQLLQEALDAIVRWTPRVDGVHIKNTLIGKLRAAIDAPEQEPVAWSVTVGKEHKNCIEITYCKADAVAQYEASTAGGFESIYALHELFSKPQPVAELADAAQDLIDVLDAYHDQLVPINRKSATCNNLRAVLELQKAKL